MAIMPQFRFFAQIDDVGVKTIMAEYNGRGPGVSTGSRPEIGDSYCFDNVTTTYKYLMS